MTTTLVFGLGTGRSGTVSLANLLDSQEDASFSHESTPSLAWSFSREEIDQKVKLLTGRAAAIVGDVASWYLPYVEHLITEHPQSKFICLEREKEAVVASFMKKTQRRNHWMHHDGKVWQNDPTFDRCLPKYNTHDKADSIGMYWEEYHERLIHLRSAYPDNIRTWEMNQGLNTKQGIREILLFAGIPVESQIVITNIKENQTGRILSRGISYIGKILCNR